MSTHREQELVNLTFRIALAIAFDEWFTGKDRDQIADWVRNTLRDCDFNVSDPVGSSWGVLRD